MEVVHIAATPFFLFTWAVILAALVLFALAGLGCVAPKRLQFLGWGLFAWLLSTLLRSCGLIVVLVLASSLSASAAAPSAAPIVYELACPAGYSPIVPMGRSFDSKTGKWRANLCISDTGDGTTVCQMNGCGVPQKFLQAVLATDYGLVADTRVEWNCTFNTSTTVICPQGNFSASDVGKIVFGTNAWPLGGTQQQVTHVQVPQGTISSVTNATTIVVTVAATANNAGAGVLIWGHDDSAAMTAAWNQVLGNCLTSPPGPLTVQMPAGYSLAQSTQFSSTTTPGPGTTCYYATGAMRQGPGVTGMGVNATVLIPTPHFSFPCTGNNPGGNAPGCFFSTPNGMQVSNLMVWGAGISNPGPAAASSAAIAIQGTDNAAINNVTVMGWGSSLVNGMSYGIVLNGSEISAVNVTADGAGDACIRVDGAGPIAMFYTVGFDCVYMGMWVQSGAQVVSVNGSYGGQASVAGYCAVCVTGGANFYSIGDNIGDDYPGTDTGLIVGTNPFTGASAATAHLDSDLVAAPGTQAAKVLSGSRLYAVNTTFNDPTAAKVALQNAGSFFDLGGNTFTAATPYAGAGTIFSSASITGTVQTAGNWSTPAGSGAGQWGTSPSTACPGTLFAVAGDSHKQSCTITVGSGTVGANPVLTVTFPTAFLQAPTCEGTMVAGTATLQNFKVGVPSATAVALTYQGTPAASSTIGLVVTCGP